MRRYLSDLDLPDIYAHINEAIYGIVDGSIENISNDKAQYIKDYGFYKHSSLSTASFSNAKSVGNYAFYQCPNLIAVNVPLVENIGTFTFKGCSSLNTADFPLVTTLENGAFDECVNLSMVNLPLLQVIKPLTFRKCKVLATADFNNVTSIGTQAFYDSGITSLTLRSNTVVTLENEDAFYFTPIESGTGYIYVPSDLVDNYKSANGWSTYANQIQAIT